MRAVLRRAALFAAILGAVGAAAPAVGAYEITDLETSLVAPGLDDSGAPNGPSLLTAGAHPDAVVDFTLSSSVGGDGVRYVDEPLRTADVDFPAGFAIALAHTPHSSQRAFAGDPSGPSCPAESQIGFAEVFYPSTDPPEQQFASNQLPIYNLEPTPSVPAQAGFRQLDVVVLLNGSVRSDGDYGITVGSNGVSQAINVARLRLSLWGVPGDPAHDDKRPSALPPSTAPLQAVTSNPTRCTGEPLRFLARVTSWRTPDTEVRRESTTQPDGSPLTVTDCASLPFEPSVAVVPTTSAPDSPSGLDVTVSVPQDTTAAGRASAHLKDLSLLLPEGMSINPAAADGLQACSPAQIGLGSKAAATCPDASGLGDVRIVSALLTEPLTGKAFLARQGDNPFGTTFALYLEASGQGVRIKLPGRIDPDPATGRLRVTFSDAPQLPFSSLSVKLAGGSRAVLATPSTCGPQDVSGTATPWSGGAAKAVSSGFPIDCAPGLGGFAPSFAAGTTPALAGTFAPLTVAFGRPDGQQALTNVSVTLPPGLIARPAAVTPCTDAQAAVDACPAASKVGAARVSAGAGSAPFPFTGEVFLTGPYKGAPYGLLTRLRAVAGPLDLGTVVVRQALSIDPDTTQVSAVSDPLPAIVGGVPIRLRELSLTLDQPGFTVNPTSCATRQITGVLGGAGGGTANVASRFSVDDCQKLLLQPQLRLALSGRKANLRKGGHPGIVARLTQPAGESNLRRVEVKLPLSLALDPENAQTLCEASAAAAKAPSCPQGSAIGSARVVSPLLPEPLTGPVYIAKGVRTTKTGRQVRTLPTLVLPLRGNNLQINVRANTAVRDGKLVTQFDGIPDAAVSRFDFSLDGGRRGVLTSTKAICSASRTATVRFRGHTGKLVTTVRRLRAACN